MRRKSSGKVVLITGAAKRIGREIALSLAHEGWGVAIHYHHSQRHAETLAKELKALGRRSTLLKLDLAAPEKAGTLVTRAVKALGRLDAVIHNAAVFEKDAPRDFTPESWAKHRDVNLESALYLTQAFAHYCEKEKSNGNAIYLLDGLRGWSVSPNFFSYAMSKLALENAVELLAPALAPKLRVNGIALGPTLPGALDSPATFKKLRALSPLGRTSSPREVCDTVHFILGAPSLTGHIINLTAGIATR